jgi:hypothetical protein
MIRSRCPTGACCERFTMLNIMRALPKAVQQRIEWQTAANADRGGDRAPTADVREIAVRQALHADKHASAPTPRRKRQKKHRIVR